MSPDNGNRLYPNEVAQAEAAADLAFKQITEHAPWLESIRAISEAILSVPKEQRQTRLMKLADKINGAVMPYSACKRGCSACCNIAVVISETEARQIGSRIGVKPKRVRNQADQESVSRRFFGVPCPFLRGDVCGIYEFRPIACRTHANIGGSAFFCDTSIPPEHSYVPNINLSSFSMVYAIISMQRQEVIADIRDFFPSVALY